MWSNPAESRDETTKQFLVTIELNQLEDDQLASEKGVIIRDVTSDSPAARVGLISGQYSDSFPDFGNLDEILPHLGDPEEFPMNHQESFPIKTVCLKFPKDFLINFEIAPGSRFRHQEFRFDSQSR
jgi:hypothetical protein